MTPNQVAQHLINLTIQKAHDEQVEGLRKGISREFGLPLSAFSDRFPLLSSEDVSLGRFPFLKEWATAADDLTFLFGTK